MTIPIFSGLTLSTTQVTLEGFCSTGRTASTLTLQWNEVDGAEGYEIQYRKKGTTQWTTMTGISEPTTTISRLAADTVYEFRYRAMANSNYDTGWSTVLNAKTAAQEVKPIIEHFNGTGYTAIQGIVVNTKAAAVNSVTFNWSPSANHTATNSFLMEVWIPKKGKTPAKLIATVSLTIDTTTREVTVIKVIGLNHDDISMVPSEIAKKTNNLGFKYLITIKGLQQGTKYSVRAQASDGDKLSRRVVISASTKRYAAVKSVKSADKVPPGRGEVTLKWNESVTSKFSDIPSDRIYEVGIYNTNTKTYFFAGDEGFDLLTAGINFGAIKNQEITISGLASRKYTFGVREVAIFENSAGNVTSTVGSAIAKFSASPLRYAAVTLRGRPNTSTQGTVRITLNGASATVVPLRDGDSRIYEVGVYDSNGKTSPEYNPLTYKTYVFVDEESDIDVSDRVGWTITITGLQLDVQYTLGVREVVKDKDGNVVAASAIKKFRVAWITVVAEPTSPLVPAQPVR